jgi:hypothetical protein
MGYRRRLPESVDVTEFLPHFHGIFGLLLTPEMDPRFMQLTYMLMRDVVGHRGDSATDEDWLMNATRQAQSNLAYRANNERCKTELAKGLENTDQNSLTHDREEIALAALPEYLTWVRTQLKLNERVV